ncbi:MAG: divalent-cation tolerance protein CutA [Anaerolineae bacterium]|nr:divalent-cation tolerance protein CutA [Anaerolineae bacterium]MDW8101678.1 divalent-cation tolerance protein CutA [Anaerolineae bacterium]
MEGDFIVVLITTNSFEEALKIGRILVEEKLAACVNVVPEVFSFYWWEGKVQEDKESLMVVKTTASSFPALEGRVRELHSYTVPEIIALPIREGYKGYLDWVAGSVLR